MPTTLTNIQQDDSAVLFPALGNWLAREQAWQVPISGTVFRAGRLSFGRRFLLGLLRRAMQATRESFETELFRDRIRGFLVDVQTGRRLTLRIGEQTIPLRRPTRRGRFHEEVRLANPTSSGEQVSGQQLEMSLVDAEGLPVGSLGRVHLVSPTGLSVISDIDDTVKQTAVHCRRSMLHNTFLREFAPVSGMSELYRTWQAAGCEFHYVSSSPWQLFDPLRGYLEHFQFPLGSVHLRWFRLGDHMLRRLFLGRNPAKAQVIRGIFQRFPKRQFILVGDSGELDPEIYGSIARRFPQQVKALFIRRVPEAKNWRRRYENAFRKLPPNLWRVFDEPSELADVAVGR